MAAYPVPSDEQQAESDAPDVKLPSLSELVEWHDDWEDRTRKDRALSARDYDYYDNLQWTQEEIDELERRGQPVLTKNRIARKVNFILGDEVEKGVDPVARPKTPAHEDDARAATDGLRSTEETQDFDAIRSLVFKDMLIAGYGGALVEGDGEPDADTCAPLTHIAWDRLWWDPHSRLPDFSDGKYRGLVVWQDIDDAIADYPDAAEALESAVGSAQGSEGDLTDDKPRWWADKSRKRVKICEVYFRIGRDWYRACFTKGVLLSGPELTGYVDERRKRNVCPLVMASCYVANKSNARYGLVRALISPQDEINKRDSKALHHLSVNRVIAQRDAILDPNKFQSELAKPDGFAEFEPGNAIGTDIIFQNGTELASGHIQLAQQARADIDGIGPSSSTMPEIPQSASGKAFVARQKAAAKELAPVFASLRRWDLEVMRQNWMRICQFRDQEWWVRVSDDQELTGYRFVGLNRQVTRAERMQELLEKGVPPPKALDTAAGDMAPIVMMTIQRQLQMMQQQAQQPQQPGMPPAPQQQPPDPTQLILKHPLMQEVVTLNQAAKMAVDIIIDTTPESAIIEEQEFDAVAQLLPTVVQARPDLAPTMVRALIKASQIRSKREILAELDKGPDPQQAQQQQQTQAMQLEQAKAGVQVAQSQAQLNAARAASEQAKTQIAGAKAPSEIEKNKAVAMRDATHAGERAGAHSLPGMGPHGLG
jgi:hypothetical protein